MHPYVVAFLVAFAAGFGTAGAVVVRRLLRRGAKHAGELARNVIAEAVENTPAVQTMSANLTEMRGTLERNGSNLERLARRVMDLENRRPGGRRRTDPGTG